MLDMWLLLLLLVITLILLLATLPQARSFISTRYLGRRARPDSRTAYTKETIIRPNGDEIALSETSPRARQSWADQFQMLVRNQRLLAALVLIVIGVLALRQMPQLFAPNRVARSNQLVVLVAPFYELDGSISQTGRTVADQLVEILPERSGGRVLAQRVADPPADTNAALQLMEREGADAFIWGHISPGGVLDQTSLLPLLVYRPNDRFAPTSWDGYTGRFAMPYGYVVANAPINGQAVLPSLLGSLADYNTGNVDAAFTTLGTLADDYPALLPTLPRTLRGNMLWARGEYDQAAGEYRRGQSLDTQNQGSWSQQAQGVIADPQPLLANNLGAILQDAGDPAARAAFEQSRTLLNGQALGALDYNQGIDALRAGQGDTAVASLEQARQQLPASTALLLTLSEAYRMQGQFDSARAAYDSAVQQVSTNADATTPELRALTLNRLRAATEEQRALLQFAQALQARGPLLWELQASAAPPADALESSRTDLTQAVKDTDALAQEWNRQSAAEDAANHPVAGLIAISQSRRAEQVLRDRQRWLAMVNVAIAQARGVQPARGVGAIWAQLVGDRSPLGQARSQLTALLATGPADADTLVLLGHAQLLNADLADAVKQFDAAASIAPQRPEPVYGQALAALPSDRARARMLLAQAIALNTRYFPARQKLAEIAQADGDWPEAITQRRWLATERSSPANSIALAETLRLSGPSGYAEAERVLLPLANANDVKALTELGRVYEAHGDLAAAHDMLDRAQRAAPRDPDVAYELGQLLVAEEDKAGTSDRTEAIAQFKRAIDAKPEHIQARLALAQLTTDRTAAAIQYRAVLDSGVNDPATLKQIGDALLASGDIDVAISAYTRAITAAPDDAASHHGLAQAYLQRKRFDDAVTEEHKALDLKGGTYPAALVGLGDITLQRGDAPGAIQQYDAALQQDNSLTAAYLGIGRANAAQGFWSVAVGQFQSAVNRDPTSAEAHLWLGEALIRQNDTSAAIAEYTSAITRKPIYPEAYFGLAQAQMSANRLDEASANLSKALQQRPAYAEAWLLQGKLNEQKNDEDGAINAYGKAIGANGQLAEPHYRRALLFLRRNNISDAEGDLEAATRIQPNFPEGHYWLGRTYFAEGRAAAAREQFQQAIDQRGGTYVEARFYQGLAEEQLGQRDDAAASFKATLDQGRDSAWANEAQAALARLGQP
jgi:tetratricopeptide (TPR) repeat protein